ncbi:hypothetical protein ENTCAN_06352 [Enterobacter cancerogenus ATCC 35316]|nr:hypothetical protein ENTCAN_06352 [Enterobacter cancerogenus ATCC 35316]
MTSGQRGIAFISLSTFLRTLFVWSTITSLTLPFLKWRERGMDVVCKRKVCHFVRWFSKNSPGGSARMYYFQ